MGQGDGVAGVMARFLWPKNEKSPQPVSPANMTRTLGVVSLRWHSGGRWHRGSGWMPGVTQRLKFGPKPYHGFAKTLGQGGGVYCGWPAVTRNVM